MVVNGTCERNSVTYTECHSTAHHLLPQTSRSGVVQVQSHIQAWASGRQFDDALENRLTSIADEEAGTGTKLRDASALGLYGCGASLDSRLARLSAAEPRRVGSERRISSRLGVRSATIPSASFGLLLHLRSEFASSLDARWAILFAALFQVLVSLGRCD
jgi:hypothetical protein